VLHFRFEAASLKEALIELRDALSLMRIAVRASLGGSLPAFLPARQAVRAKTGFAGPTL